MKTDFPDPDDILHFTLTIEPDEGMYRTGRFTFSFDINQNFPHEPPKVRCKEKIYHPNIDLEGKVCLNILREDWKPVLNLNAVIVGLQVCRISHGRPGLNSSTNRCSFTVSFPRTQRLRPAEQGSRRGPQTEPRRIQAQRSDGDGRWHSQGSELRPCVEIGWPSANRFSAFQETGQPDWVPDDPGTEMSR